jgi:hypothetical protein
MIGKATIILLLFCSVLMCHTRASADNAIPTRTQTERLLVSFPGDYQSSWKDTVVSPDSRHVAVVIYGRDAEGPKEFIVVDGREQKKYDALPINSDRGKRVVFSPDSRHFSYVAALGSKEITVVDGREGKQYDKIVQSPIFSADSKRLAYVARLGSKEFIVNDSYELKAYDGINHVRFIPPRNALVYAAKTGSKWILVQDGKLSKPYDDIRQVAISSDGKRLAYIAVLEKKMFMVVDGIEGRKYDFIASSIIFSKDSRRMAYVAFSSGGEQCVVTDNSEGKYYEKILLDANAFVFNPRNNSLIYGARREGKEFLVVDGKEGKQYERIVNTAISPDGKRIAYVAQTEKKWCVVENEVQGKAYSGQIAYLTFSPDGAKLVYGVFFYPRAVVAINAKEEMEHDYVGPFTFSPDGRFLAYPASQFLSERTSLDCVVVNGNRGKQYKDTVNLVVKDGGAIVFDSPATFHYLARKDDGIYLVEERIR